MPDIVNPKSHPTASAYQLTLEMIKAGSFASESQGGERKATDVIKFFDALKDRFEKLNQS